MSGLRMQRSQHTHMFILHFHLDISIMFPLEGYAAVTLEIFFPSSGHLSFLLGIFSPPSTELLTPTFRTDESVIDYTRHLGHHIQALLCQYHDSISAASSLI